MKPIRYSLSLKFVIAIVAALQISISFAQTNEVLPPVLPWTGKSLELIVKKDHAWMTTVEETDVTNTRSYAETVTWLERASESSNMLHMIAIGKSGNGRAIYMVIASHDGRSE